MPYTSEDKLQREVEKLTEEVKVLKKPYLQPTFWIGIIALALSVAGNIGQALSYEHKATIAKADVAQAKLDRIEMEQKRDAAKSELAELQNQLSSVQETIAQAKKVSTSAQVQQQLDDADKKLTTLQDTAQTTKQSLSTSESKATQDFRDVRQNNKIAASGNDLPTAKAKEREGFQNLIDGNYDQAIAAFQAAETAYNSYNSVYEIARLLRQNRSQMADPATKKQVLQRIATDYPHGAPDDLLQRVKSIANR